MERIKHSDFVKQISKATGYPQKYIATIFDAAKDVIIEDLNDMKSIAVMKGMIVYPGIYPMAVDRKDEDGNIIHCEKVLYPRAKFTSVFKDNLFYS